MDGWFNCHSGEVQVPMLLISLSITRVLPVSASHELCTDLLEEPAAVLTPTASSHGISHVTNLEYITNPIPDLSPCAVH